ncbi:hypothetical protein [Rhodococcoides fascians]|uniref:hypothetical protein n=1 Tax=Rhodococcoides fascians TaxID=1828 RepID=UPI00050CAB2E|nr:hypothetical protein [Rhodococcus fascians]AMY53631.1 hypothetical protein A3L23_02290 [Rhodococcus fascians D188]
MTTTTQFEFRLKNIDAPEGELDADQLIALVQSLKAVAMNIGRIETDADRLGRAPARVHRVANLVVGLAPGSTRLLVRRAGAGSTALEFDLADERAFDDKFERLVMSIGLDERPDWVSDSLSNAAGALAAALRHAAPEVEFKADGQLRQAFTTAELRSATWELPTEVSSAPTVFVGRLYSANLHTHRLQVQDDVGNQIALPGVAENEEVGPLLGRYVMVTGSPESGADGRVRRLLNATIVALPDPIAPGLPEPASLGEILVGAAGLEPGGIDGVSDDEADAFFGAIGL